MADYADDTADKINDGVEIGDIGYTAVEAAGGELGTPAGMVVAAGAGGYALGREFDKATGASDKISDVMPGGQAAKQAWNDAGVSPVTGQAWKDEKTKIDTQQAIQNGSPMSPAQADDERFRLRNQVPQGDDIAAARELVCEPYAK